MKLGSSSLVVAAFIGPGTVLTCASAGVQFGTDLGWVLVFSTAAVFVLQSFTAATGILTGRGLGEALREAARRPAVRSLIVVLVVLGLWVGCAAFETGNLLGAGAGIEAAVGAGRTAQILVVAGLATAVLAFDIRWITHFLAILVGVMSILFVAAAVMAPVDWSAFLMGIVRPRVPAGSLVTVVALMGTTIVTYNLFLHASASKASWHGTPAGDAWRLELRGMLLFIPLGGLISLAILAAGSAVAAHGEAPSTVAGFARVLEPAVGPAARYLFAGGLFAAGITSAVTAPLAAAAGTSELFGWDREAHPARFRLIWMSVVGTGTLFALTGASPLRIIVAAQAANGLLLPLIAGLVVLLAARQQTHRLPGWHLGLGAVIVLVCAGFGVRTLLWVWSRIG